MLWRAVQSQGRDGRTMTDPSKAVFMSYASQDAEAATRICATLRAAGIEVWFDQSELQGGDAWNLKIHQRVRDCALFAPIISANTEGRREGYFRREWHLAADRTHDLSDRAPFLVPVVIDDTREKGADVPESFLKVQWTRLPLGETSAAFCEQIKALLDGAATPRHTSVDAAPAQRVALPRKHSSWLVGVIVGALAVAVIGWQSWRLMQPSAGTTAAPLAAAAVAEKSIAVLPFVDMSEKHDQEYFSDGLSEELIDHLAHNADLKVIARTSSFAFKGKTEDMRTIATKLGVANLLEGSVRKSGNELRITAQLIRASDGVHLWSESYERRLTDVFKVQEDIAAAVVKGLQARLLPVSPRPHAVSRNIEAYSLYLKGQYFARRASDVDVEQGIASLRQAIALERDFAPAHAELASAYVYVGTFGTGERSILERARDEVDEALRLDPALRSARNLRANLAIISWDWIAAKRQLDELLASGPRDPEALLRRGQLARALGHTDEALSYFRQALQLDPLLVISHIQLAMLLNAMGNPSEARAAAETALAINPMVTKAHLLIALLELDAGHVDAASDAVERESGDYYRLEGQSIVTFAQQRLADSNKALGRLIDVYYSTSAIQIAQAYAYRGERAKAFEWLDHAIAQKDPGLVNVKTDPLFANLHSDLRFKGVLRKMNLPET